ncbi:MAG: phenylalanine--tRNA ligase subunit alpha [Sphingobacteriales bacterium]|nr:phenylalanine--tRNA ligase subunit alpha [Sphingobacteriales bacterium]
MSQELLAAVHQKIAEIAQYPISDAASLEQFRIAYLGSKNELKDLFGEMRNVSPDLKKEFGQLLNTAKQNAEQRHETEKKKLASAKRQTDIPDLSLPAAFSMGTRHPISAVRNEVCNIFRRLGFVIEEDREIEDDWHNFTALNFPPEHPARDMQDTFFIDEQMALRTHTSSVQVRLMEKSQPPIRAIMPGRVYRNETISARSHCQFHQVEGLFVAENVSLADLKQTLFYFAQEMFGKDTKIRFRPSYFPFTEISAEMDVSCFICHQKGCNVCKHSGWVEILGCGMVDPNVFDNCGIDSNRYTGFAFGMGIERIAMLKYRINDIRHFFENDLRFLKQFAGI